MSSKSAGGCAFQLRTPDFGAALDYYSRMFQRPADIVAGRAFAEWQLVPGFWFQIAHGVPLPTYPVRIRVEKIQAAIERVSRELGTVCSIVTHVPGIVDYCDFEDPWGNRLGFYEILYVGPDPRLTAREVEAR